jgi:LPXTG-motif cell wall-anchored protein
LKITQGTYLKQGQSSAVFWFATNATKYQETDFSIQDSGAVGSSKGYAPVPGPTTLLGLVGLSGMGFVMTWRRKKTA